MPHTTLLRLTASAVLLAMVALAACAPQQVASPPTTSVSGGPPVGHLVVAQHGDTTSLDPTVTYNLHFEAINHNIFDTLWFRGPDLKYEPGLATGYKLLDSNTWEFTLRQGVKFHNGEDFDAESVKFTLDRVRDPATRAPHRSLYQTIKEVKVVDKYTVHIITTEPDPVLHVKLSGYGGNLLPPKYFKEVGAEEFGRKPVGTGPFKFVEWVKDQHLKLEANESYWRGAPKVKNVTFRPVPDGNTRLAELLTGAVHIINKVHPSMIQQIDSSGKGKVHKTPGLGIQTFRMDTNRAPVNNVKVRQALAHAVDYDTIINKLLGGNALRVAAHLTPFHFGYDAALKPYPHDQEKARALLREAGMEGKVTIEISVQSNLQDRKEMAEALIQQFKQVGINAALRLDEPATYVDKMYKGELGHLTNLGWGGWTIDADNTYWSLYATEGQKNYRFGKVFYSNSKLDELLRAARYEMDETKRLGLYHQANKIIYEDVPQLVMYQNMELWAALNSVQDWVAPPDDRLWLWPVSVK